MGNCCEGKDDETKSSTTTTEEETFQEFIVAKRWKETRFIGKGSFGRVYEVVDLKSKNKDDNSKYAINVEIVRNRKGILTGRLPHECQIIEDIRKRTNGRHLVDIIDKGSMPKDYHRRPAQYVVMTLLRPSLVDLGDLIPKNAFSPTTMAVIGKQALDVVQKVHECGYLHRDIKPANFAVGRGEMKHEIYLIDFGLARKYVGGDGKILAPRLKAPFRGSTPYISYNAFHNREQAPVDDLWSLFYTLIDLRIGTLPWGRFSRSTLANERKREVIPAYWFKDIEPEYLWIHDYLTSLHYDMLPDYHFLNDIFKDLMKRLHVTHEMRVDWEQGGEYYPKIEQRELRRLFNE